MSGGGGSPETRGQAGQLIDTLRLGTKTGDHFVQPQLDFPEGISGHRDVVQLIVVQQVFIDVMQKRSDIMPFGPVKTPVFDVSPRFAAFKGLFGLLRFPSDLTPILMVQDILNNIGVAVEVPTLGVKMEGGVHTILLR